MGFFGEDSYDEDGVASADFVTVDESGFFDTRAVEESAVAALEIEEATAFFAAVDGEVEAGHALVVGERLIGIGVAADAKGLIPVQGNPFPRVRC
jgi:hypothetical protein